MIILISDWPQKWAVSSLSKNLLYANPPDRFIGNHAKAEFYYVLLSNNYVAHGIELEHTNYAGLTHGSDVGKLAAARLVNYSKSGAVLTIPPFLGFYTLIKHYHNVQIASSVQWNSVVAFLQFVATARVILLF